MTVFECWLNSRNETERIRSGNSYFISFMFYLLTFELSEKKGCVG
jgi:hypothetical protein